MKCDTTNAVEHMTDADWWMFGINYPEAAKAIQIMSLKNQYKEIQEHLSHGYTEEINRELTIKREDLKKKICDLEGRVYNES